MPETTLVFNPTDQGEDLPTPPNTRYLFDPVVEWKSRWSDEWEEAPLTFEECTWATCGDGKIGSAIFRKRYGRGRKHGESQMSNVAREDGAVRRYVRVTMDVLLGTEMPDGDEVLQRYWYGVLGDDTQDRHGTYFDRDPLSGSIQSGVSQGVQTFRALGLEYLLSQTFVKSAWIARDLAATESVETKRGLTFNRDGIPNCSDVDDLDGGRFFHEGVDSIHWTTHQAVRYLLKRHAPLSFDGDAEILFELEDTGNPILPDFDFPQLETDGRSVYDLLCTLISRQRGYGFYLKPRDPSFTDGVSESPIYLKPFTFVREDVDLDPEDASKKLPANPDVYLLDIESDRSSGGARLIKRTTERFDRVIVRGARRRSCFTVSFADGNLQNDWNEEDETAYNEGASGAEDYPAEAEIEERQRRDEEARISPKLRDVFSRFRFPEEWDLKAGNGEGGEEKNPILPPDVGDGFELPEEPTLFLPEVRVLRTLPLLEKIDYSGTAILDHQVEQDKPINDGETAPELSPMGLLMLVVDTESDPQEVRWLHLDSLENMAHFATAFGEEGDLRWSAEVEPLHDTPGFALPVRGASQHVIALTRFNPTNPAAEEPWFFYEDFLFTIAVEEDRFCEGTYEEDPGVVGSDAVRELILEAGDDFRKDYVVPQTVVGVDGTTGELLRTESGGYVRDDSKLLKETARLAFEFYKVGRVAMAYQTGDMERILQLPLGGYVRSIGRESVGSGNHNQDIESVVTEITARFGTASGPNPPAPTFSFRTDFVELDMRRKGLA